MNYRQKYWLKWLATAEFAVNNKVYSTTKMSSFIANYNRKLRIGVDIKSREGNGVCRKNEGTERSWSSIEKSTRRDEVASR